MINKTSIRTLSALVMIAALTVMSGCSSTGAGYNAASADKTNAYGTHDGWRSNAVYR